MKSIIVITGKCLLLAVFIIASCTIADQIDFNLDFSGSRTIEFQYRDESDKLIHDEDNPMLLGLRYIDSLSRCVNNINNFKIDTTDYEMAKISYDFSDGGPQIKDVERYNYFTGKLPEELGWYFTEQPNSFKVISDKKLLWRAIAKDIDGMTPEERIKLSKYLSGISMATNVSFQKRIQSISPELVELTIGKNRKSIQVELDLQEIALRNQSNEMVITFE